MKGVYKMPIGCKDCKFSHINSYFELCEHEKSGNTFNAITGKTLYRHCFPLRKDAKECGPGAKWFEKKPDPIPKLTLWKRFDKGFDNFFNKIKTILKGAPND